MKKLSYILTSLLFLTIISGCTPQQSTEKPEPQALTREAIGNYCNMIIADHPGPKAQIYIRGKEQPLWFSSVRDAFSYLYLPGENKNITAFYVNDATNISDWQKPPSNNWMDGMKAWYVIGSQKRGGMGALEAVPFATKKAAENFIEQHGGNLVPYRDVPVKYVLSTDEQENETS